MILTWSLESAGLTSAMLRLRLEEEGIESVSLGSAGMLGCLRRDGQVA